MHLSPNVEGGMGGQDAAGDKEVQLIKQLTKKYSSENASDERLRAAGCH